MDLLLHIAQGVASVTTDVVVQAVTDQTARPFGLTIPEWSILLGAIAAFMEGLRQRAGKLRASGETVSIGQKYKAVKEALDEGLAANPESRRTVRKLAKHKATQMGISLDGLAKLLESKDDEPDEPDDKHEKKESDK